MKLSIWLSSFALLFAVQSANASQMYKPTLTQEGNRWTITFHNDAASNHTRWATQGLCFYYVGNIGTHEVYHWVSDTYPDWNGIARKEGDQVFMHGDYANDVGHDSMDWELVTMVNDWSQRPEYGAGHWKEWRENGKFGSWSVFGNTLLQRVGKCAIYRQAKSLSVDDPDEIGMRLAEQAMEKYMDLEIPTDENGRPLTPNGEYLEQ